MRKYPGKPPPAVLKDEEYRPTSSASSICSCESFILPYELPKPHFSSYDSPLVIYFFQTENTSRLQVLRAEARGFARIRRSLLNPKERNDFMNEENQRVERRSERLSRPSTSKCSISPEEQEDFLKEEEKRQIKRLTIQLQYIQQKEQISRQKIEEEENLDFSVGVSRNYEILIGEWLRDLISKHDLFNKEHLTHRTKLEEQEEIRREELSYTSKLHLERAIFETNQSQSRKMIEENYNSEMEHSRLLLSKHTHTMAQFEEQKNNLQKSEANSRMEIDDQELQTRELFIIKVWKDGWSSLSALLSERVQTCPLDETNERLQLELIQELSVSEIPKRLEIITLEKNEFSSLHQQYKLRSRSVLFLVEETKTRYNIQNVEKIERLQLSESSRRGLLLSFNNAMLERLLSYHEKQLRTFVEQSQVTESLMRLPKWEELKRQGILLLQQLEILKVKVEGLQSQKRVGIQMDEVKKRYELERHSNTYKIQAKESETRRVIESDGIYGAQLYCVELCETLRRNRMLEYYFDSSTDELKAYHKVIQMYLIRNTVQNKERGRRMQTVQLERESWERIEQTALSEITKLRLAAIAKQENEAATTIQCLIRKKNAELTTKNLRGERSRKLEQEKQLYFALKILSVMQRCVARVHLRRQAKILPIINGERDHRGVIEEEEQMESTHLQYYKETITHLKEHETSREKLSLDQAYGFTYLALVSQNLNESHLSLLHIIQLEQITEGLEQIHRNMIWSEHQHGHNQIVIEFCSKAMKLAVEEEQQQRVVIIECESKNYQQWQSSLGTGVSNYIMLERVRTQMIERQNLSDRERDRRKRLEKEYNSGAQNIFEWYDVTRKQLSSRRDLMTKERRERRKLEEDNDECRIQIQNALRFQITQMRVHIMERGIGPVIAVKNLPVAGGVVRQAARSQSMDSLPQVVMWAIDKKEASSRFELARSEMETRESINSTFRRVIQAKESVSPIVRARSISPIPSRPLMHSMPQPNWHHPLNKVGLSSSAAAAAPVYRTASSEGHIKGLPVGTNVYPLAGKKAGAALAAWLSDSSGAGSFPF